MEPDPDLHGLLEGLAKMPGVTDETVDLLEELQRAVREHHRILERQSDLIRRLREDLKDVRRGDEP